MLYFLYGENKDEARAKVHRMILSLQKKKPDAAFFRIDSESWSEATLEEYIGGQGLFSNKYIVFVDSVFENKETKEAIMKKMKEIGESQNIFIFLEGGVDKATLTKVEKYAEKVECFSFPDVSSMSVRQKEFNIFSLGDAFLSRDRKSLWVLYFKAQRAGIETEQIHGTLFWAIKNMIVVNSSESAKEVGLNPYVYSKTKSFSKNFKKEELQVFAGNLVLLYHDSRRGILKLDVALERFILSI